MFSLIITIISIALVAALALATLYYGGSSWTRGNAAASAATLTNQGQQIRGAMELYYSQKSAYPQSLQDLIDGEYLKTIPVPPQTVAALDATLVAPALAADEVWALLAAGQPAFMVHESISKDVCQELNYLNRGSDAIYAKIDGKSTAQCFGKAEGPFTFVVGVPGAGGAGASLEKAVEKYNEGAGPDLPIADAGGLTPDEVTVPETRNKYAQSSGGGGAPSGGAGTFSLAYGPDSEWPAWTSGCNFSDPRWHTTVLIEGQDYFETIHGTEDDHYQLSWTGENLTWYDEELVPTQCGGETTTYTVTLTILDTNTNQPLTPSGANSLLINMNAF